MKPLNLASRPFRNERLGEALFATGAFALLAVTAWHALVIRDLLPARTSGLHREVAALDGELRSLRTEAASRRTETPTGPVLAQWMLVKELVDRRTFSWAGLFASLEGVIPDDVRLVSITPSVRKGQVEVDVTATVRQPAAGWEFVRALQAHGEFYDVFPTSEADREFRYEFRYRPQPPGEPAGPPAPTVTAGASPAPASASPSAASAGAASPVPSAAGTPGPGPAPEIAAGSPSPSVTAPTPPAGPATVTAGSPPPMREGLRRRPRLGPAGATRGRE